MLFLTIKVQEKYYDPTQKEVRITQIDFLQDIREKYLEKLTLTIRLDELNENLVSRLHQLTTTEQGNTTLNIEIVDYEDRYKVDLYAPSFLINVDKKWIKALDEMNLTYKVN